MLASTKKKLLPNVRSRRYHARLTCLAFSLHPSAAGKVLPAGVSPGPQSTPTGVSRVLLNLEAPSTSIIILSSSGPTIGTYLSVR